MHSSGYRFDWEKKRVVQTGAFYFKVSPPDAEIYIKGKLAKKTSFLFSTAFVENLLPKKYEIQIKKEGYHSWKKTLEVKEKLVTEAKNIVLIPENPYFEFLGDERSLLKISTPLRDESLTESTSSAAIENIIWSSDSKKVLLKTVINEEIKYFISDLGVDSKFPLIPLDFLGTNVSDVSFHPSDSSKIFFRKNSKLFESDFITKIPRPVLKNLVSYKLLSDSIIWLSNEGFLSRSDFSGTILEILNLKPIAIEPETEYKILGPNQSKIFLKKAGELFFLNPDSRKIEKISDSVQDLAFSPDSQKIAYFNNYEISIFFLEQQYGQPQRHAFEKVFITRFSEKIDKVFWLTSHYLIFNAGDKIKVSEIDDRDEINIVDLAVFPNPKIFWNKGEKSLYLLSNGNFYKSSGLIK